MMIKRNICFLVVVHAVIIGTIEGAESPNQQGNTTRAAAHESSLSDMRSILQGSISDNVLTFNSIGSALNEGLPTKDKFRALPARNKTTWTVPTENQAYAASALEINRKSYRDELNREKPPSDEEHRLKSVTLNNVVDDGGNVSISMNKLLWALNHAENNTSNQTTRESLSRQKRQSSVPERAKQPQQTKQPQQRIMLLMSRDTGNTPEGRSTNRLVNNNNGDILLVVRQAGGVPINITHLTQQIPITSRHNDRNMANRPSQLTILTKSQGTEFLNRLIRTRTDPTKSTQRQPSPTQATLRRASPTQATLRRASPTRPTLQRKITTKSTVKPSSTGRTLRRTIPTLSTLRRTTSRQREHVRQQNPNVIQRISAPHRRVTSHERRAQSIAAPARSRSLVRTISSNDLLRRRQQRRHPVGAAQLRTGAASQRSRTPPSGQRRPAQPRQTRPDPFTQRFSAGFAHGSSLLVQPPMDFMGFDGTRGQNGGPVGRPPGLGSPGPFGPFPGFQPPQFPDFSQLGFGGRGMRGPGMFR